MVKLDEEGRLNVKRIDCLEPYKDLFTKKLWKLWGAYKYHLHFQVVKFETEGEME